ncbi:MAG: OmpA family [Bacteroidetes bacterium]|jgi:outer membrane protein OmpA-like peptidoglycan-associated protein|nr:OmpA family [Bacteroidota bacterium]
MKYFLVLLQCLVFSFLGFSQKDEVTIKGIALCVPDKYGDTLPVVAAKIYFRFNDSISFVVPTDENGRYQVEVPRFKGKINVTCVTTKESKVKGKKRSVVFTPKDVKVIDLSKSLTPVFVANFSLHQACVLYRAPDILFKINSLETESGQISEKNIKDSISLLVDIMNDDPHCVVEIVGHSDADEKDKNAISLKRAELVVQAIVEKGIQKERLKVTGKGDQQMLYPSSEIKKAKTTEEKARMKLMNRRVTWRIVSWDYGVDPTKKQTSSSDDEE